ncbi:MAG: hypothetical protein COA58_13950 [Bacteroidetes bacterium]|nr:MAG: hypothetical protein COA58_13950 [Bacteroidota bacterium]
MKEHAANKLNMLRLYRGPYKNMGTGGGLMNLLRGQPGYPEKHKTTKSTEKRDASIGSSGPSSGMGLKHQIDLEL